MLIGKIIINRIIDDRRVDDFYTVLDGYAVFLRTLDILQPLSTLLQNALKTEMW